MARIDPIKLTISHVEGIPFRNSNGAQREDGTTAVVPTTAQVSR